MSEQLDPATSPLRDDDPLVELARIVSGEDVDSSPDVTENRTTETSSGTPTGSDEFRVDLEAELMRELGGPAADEPPAVAAAPAKPAPSTPQAQTAQSGEDAFQDELMQAMQNVVEPTHAQPTQNQPAPAEPQQAAPPQHPEPAPQMTAPSAPQPITAAQDTSADLGTAFAAEFEQMIEQSQSPPLDPVAEQFHNSPVETQLPEGNVSNQPQVNSVDEQFAASTEALRQKLFQEIENTPADPDVAIEAEFGAAFAEELGMGGTPVDQGWDSHEAAPGIAEDSFRDPGHADDMTDMQPNAVQGRGGKRYAVAALAIALVAGLGAAGYGFFDGGTPVTGEAPIIKADTDPVKIKPEDPGGRQIANQDKASYETVADTGAENNTQDSLISNTEEPAELASLGEPKSDERLTADVAEPEVTSAAGIEPRKVRTVTVKPDGTILLPESVDPLLATQNQIAATTEPAETVEALGLAAASEPTDIAASEPTDIDGAQSSGDIGVPSLSPVPKPDPVDVASANIEEVASAAMLVDETATIADENVEAITPVRSEWAVQVSSQRSPEAAQASYQNLRDRFGTIFAGRQMAIQRAVIEDKGTFYRVRIQTASKNDAAQFCSEFKSAGGSCFVTR